MSPGRQRATGLSSRKTRDRPGSGDGRALDDRARRRQPTQLTRDARTGANNSAPDWSPGRRTHRVRPCRPTDSNNISIEAVAADGTGRTDRHRELAWYLRAVRRDDAPAVRCTKPAVLVARRGASLYAALPDPATGALADPVGESGRLRTHAAHSRAAAPRRGRPRAEPGWRPPRLRAPTGAPTGGNATGRSTGTVRCHARPGRRQRRGPDVGLGPLAHEHPGGAAQSPASRSVPKSCRAKSSSCGLRRRLEGAAIVPVGRSGCLVDARRGAVRITAVADSESGRRSPGSSPEASSGSSKRRRGARSPSCGLPALSAAPGRAARVPTPLRGAAGCSGTRVGASGPAAGTPPPPCAAPNG